MSIKQTLQRTRGGNWRQSNLTGLFHHVKSLFGLNILPLGWLCWFVILSLRSLLPYFLPKVLVTSCVRTLVSFLFCWCYLPVDCCESPGEAWNAGKDMHWEPKEQNSGVSTNCGWAVSLFSTYLLQRWSCLQLCGSHRALKLTLENRIYLKKNLWNQFKLKKEMETDVCWEMWGECPWVLINAQWDQCYPDNTHLVLVTSHKASVRKNGKTYRRNNGSFSFLNAWKCSHWLTDWIGKFWYKWRWLTLH